MSRIMEYRVQVETYHIEADNSSIKTGGIKLVSYEGLDREYLTFDFGVDEIYEQLLDDSNPNYVLSTVWVTVTSVSLVYTHLPDSNRVSLTAYRPDKLNLELRVKGSKDMPDEVYHIERTPRKACNSKGKEFLEYFLRITEYLNGLKRIISFEEHDMDKWHATIREEI